MKNPFVILIAAALVLGGGWLLLNAYEAREQHESDHAHDEHRELIAKEPVRADGSFTITTSFYPLQFALEQIAGDLAVVTNIGAGVDPHDFRPSTQDILALQQADLVVLQGVEYEPWGDAVIEQLETAAVPVAIATAGLVLREAGADSHGHGEEEEHHEDEAEHEDEHDHGSFDPHTWLDPVLFSETVAELAEALGTLDPDNTATYETNAAALQAELATLNTEYQTILTSCELEETITNHDAFGYVADRYDIMIHTIAGISTQDLPSAQTLAELREEAAEGVGAILIEESSVSAYGETLAAETGLQTLPINPIAYIIPDGADYLSLMRANLNTFSTALACNG